jgi:hypothetical protein
MGDDVIEGPGVPGGEAAVARGAFAPVHLPVPGKSVRLGMVERELGYEAVGGDGPVDCRCAVYLPLGLGQGPGDGGEYERREGS